MQEPKRIGDDLLLQEAYLREDAITGAADAINDKASQIFAASAVLAVQPSIILVMGSVATIPLILQGLAILPLIASVVFAHFALSIKDFEAPNPDEIWRDQMVAQAGENATDEERRDYLLWGLLLGSKARIAKNEACNKERLGKVYAARGCLLATMILNGIVLLSIVAIRFF